MESALLLLAVLACPVGMGLMMWFMGRHQRTQPTARTETIDDLRAEHRRVSAELDRLEPSPDRDDGQLAKR
jgi:preprotein translocase subunit YajC